MSVSTTWGAAFPAEQDIATTGGNGGESGLATGENGGENDKANDQNGAENEKKNDDKRDILTNDDEAEISSDLENYEPVAASSTFVQTQAEMQDECRRKSVRRCLSKTSNQERMKCTNRLVRICMRG